MLKYTKYLAIFFILIGATGLFLFLQKKRVIEITDPNASSTITSSDEMKNPDEDDIPQKPLANPPTVIKAVYFTGWSAGIEDRVNYLTELIKTTELNAAVIDIKDYSGYVLYDIKLPEVEKYKAKEIRISKINSLIKRLHNEGIYVIARILVFQDPVLARSRGDLAIKNKNTGKLWLDNKNLAWMDPAAREVWDYNIAIAKEAAERGFDELNFDYIRFPSEGDLDNMAFPFWDKQTPKREIIANFSKYLRQELPNVKISADLFGIATIKTDDLGIGQVIEDAYSYFDYVSPMVYPSHYENGFMGYKNPAQHPYEIVKYSIESAVNRLKIYDLGFKNASSTATSSNEILTSYDLNLKPRAKLRPWLQDFNLGADYDAAAVRKEIQAVYDAASSTPEIINGFMLWSPSNVYTQ